MNLFSAEETTRNYCEAGVKKCAMSAPRLLVLGLLSGLIIAFGASVTNVAAHNFESVALVRVVSGLLFPFGLIMVVLTGAELFTGNCLITISLLEKRVTFAAMLRNLAIVYIANFAGSILVAAGCAFFGQFDYSAGGLAVYTIKLAAAKCTLGFGKAFVFGIFCNMLVTLGVLLSLSAKDVAGRFFGAYMPVCMFTICGFEHSVANMYYIPAGLLALRVPGYADLAAAAGIDVGSLTWGSFLGGNLLPVTLGNVVGGVAVAFIFWFAWMRKESK